MREKNLIQHETLSKIQYLHMMRYRDFLATAIRASTVKRIGASPVHGRGLLVSLYTSLQQK